MLVAVVEDDDLLATPLRLQLEASGFRVETLATGAAALARFERHDLDAAVVDIGLPDIDGIEVIAEARRRGMWAPILVATARADLAARVRVLEVGADDYVVKPYASAEIIARLTALGRRAAAPRWAPLACGDVVLNADRHDAIVAGRSIQLSPRERDLLQFLLRRRSQIVTREEILAQVFGYTSSPGTNLVDVHIAHLRSKLDGGRVTIRTIRGTGFCLERSDG
jgi:DNA-binding response OmpR family regulator